MTKAYELQIKEAKAQKLPPELIKTLEEGLASIKAMFCNGQSGGAGGTSLIKEVTENNEAEEEAGNAYKPKLTALPANLITLKAIGKVVMNYQLNGKTFDLDLWIDEKGDVLVTGDNMYLASKLLGTAEEGEAGGKLDYYRITKEGQSLVSYTTSKELGKVVIDISMKHTQNINEASSSSNIQFIETGQAKTIAGIASKGIQMIADGEKINGFISNSPTPSIIKNAPTALMFGLMQGMGKYQNRFFLQTSYKNEEGICTMTIKSITNDKRTFEFSGYQLMKIRMF